MGASGNRRRSPAIALPVDGLGAAAFKRLLAEGSSGLDLELLREIGRVAAARGAIACLVGGAVRDLLLDRPALEPDVVVDRDGLAIAEDLARRLRGERIVHRAFGTAVVQLPDGLHLDVANARRERYAHPAALPTVEPASLDEDALRRDFSVNALRIDLSPGRFGELHDPLDGLADLGARRLRALHAASFDDDPTRAYRAVRFAGRLDFAIEPTTVEWIGGALERGAFARLSPQRLRREFELLFDDQHPIRATMLLGRLDLLQPLDEKMRVGRRQAMAVGDVLARLGRWSDGSMQLPARRWLGALALLAAPLDDAGLGDLVRRLGPDRHGRSVLLASGGGLQTLARELARVRRPSRVVALAAGRSLETLAAAAGVTNRAARAVDDYVEHFRWVRADVDGRALMAAGAPQGPALAQGLAAARAVKLDRGAGPKEQMQAALAAARGGRQERPRGRGKG